MELVSGKGHSLLLRVRLQPGASREGIDGVRDGELWLRVAVKPEKGKANRAAAEFLAETLDLPKSAVRIVRGELSRHKTFEINGLTRETLIRILGK